MGFLNDLFGKSNYRLFGIEAGNLITYMLPINDKTRKTDKISAKNLTNIENIIFQSQEFRPLPSLQAKINKLNEFALEISQYRNGDYNLDLTKNNVEKWVFDFTETLMPKKKENNQSSMNQSIDWAIYLDDES